MVGEAAPALDGSMIQPIDISRRSGAAVGLMVVTHMRKGDRFFKAGDPIDRLTIAPTPSGVSRA